jgi:hypothetical protein
VTTRPRFESEVEQASVDEQEASALIDAKRAGRDASYGTDVGKGPTLGEESAVPIPLPPQTWIKSVDYDVVAQCIVPARPYPQYATLIGANQIAFQISYEPVFRPGQWATVPGDRNVVILLLPGQDLWMRTTVVIPPGNTPLAVFVEPVMKTLEEAK